jgi:hypothetical protein
MNDSSDQPPKDAVSGDFDREQLEMIALALVETCVRNTQLENLHAGQFPGSPVGDYSDVKVVSPYGEIPWTNLSRISDSEMEALMIEVVNRVFTFLQYPAPLGDLRAAARWNRPQLDPALMRTIERRRQRRDSAL